MPKKFNCRQLEVFLLKIDYEKVWFALLALGGGPGTILFKNPDRVGLLILTFLLGLGLVIALLFLRLKILKLAKLLEKCKGD
jgi:hypothetical protein